MSLKVKALPALLFFSLVSPLASAQPDSGLLISRTTNEQWQIRLIASDQPQQFNGVIESTVPFKSATSLQPDGLDEVRLDTAGTLTTTLSAWPGRMDGVQFEVPATAQLCLRDVTATGTKIYYGESLAEAIPISAPFSLAGADACNGDTLSTVANIGETADAATDSTISTAITSASTTAPTATASLTAIAAGRKFHPGHYVAMVRGASSQSAMTQAIKPGVKGIQKRYTWRSLEPTLGNYNFNELQSDLNWAKAHGMRLIAMIEDKTFKLERPTPAYLDSYTPRNRAGGYTVVRWSPYVVARMNALTKAIGARFDSNTAFEGIATQETSLGFDDGTLNAFNYTPEKYRDAYINMLSTAANNLPSSRVFWYQNFFVRNQDYIGAIANAVAPKGVVMGGPDVLPDNSALRTKSYPFYDRMRDKMHLSSQVEDICYRALHMTSGYRTKYWTPAELFRYARDDLHVSYMFWVRIPNASPADSYDWYDSLPVISSNVVF
jgi:hypothetical protein